MGEFSREWLDSLHRLEESTRERYGNLLKSQVLPAFGALRLSQITAQSVEGWVQNLRGQGLAPVSINLALFVLRRVIAEGVRRRLIQSNPVSDVRSLPKPQKEMLFWTKDEAATFLKFCRSEVPECYPMFFLALNTGMRFGEVVGLRWDCVDFERKQVTVRRTVCSTSGLLKETTKGKRIRHVPINSGLDSLLRALKADNGADEFVLPRRDFWHMSRMTRGLARKAGVKEIRFHDTRHTFAALWMMSGQSIYELQKVLGHSSVTMTEKYSHLSPEHLREKTEFLKFDC